MKLWNIKNVVHVYGWWLFIFWPMEWMLGFLHLFGMSHLLETFFRLGTRKLTTEEIELAKSVYGNRINYSIVRIRPASKFAKRYHVAFVTGNVINYHKQTIPKYLLIHELMHVYQFEQVGLVYVSRCLFAQSSKEGYNFGKLANHEDVLSGQCSVNKLNYEQQAAFVEALFRAKTMQRGRPYANVSFEDLNLQL